MSKIIIAENRLSTQPPQDLPCPDPDCRSGMAFSSAAAQLTCPTCGLYLPLSDEEAGEIAGTLAGIFDLPLAAYLITLYAVHHAPLSPDGGAYPATVPAPLWLYCAPQDAYLFPDDDDAQVAA
jgi:hypothetical protein